MCPRPALPVLVDVLTNVIVGRARQQRPHGRSTTTTSTITLGVGVPSGSAVFDAGLYFKVKSEVVSNLTIPDPFAPGKPSCLQVSCGAGAYFGGSLTLFGAQIDRETTICAENRVLAKSGAACP